MGLIVRELLDDYFVAGGSGHVESPAEPACSHCGLPLAIESEVDKVVGALWKLQVSPGTPEKVMPYLGVRSDELEKIVPTGLGVELEGIGPVGGVMHKAHLVQRHGEFAIG